MKFLNHMRVGVRLSVLLTGVTVLMLVIAYIGLSSLQATVRQSEATFHQIVVPEAQLAELIQQYGEIRTQVLLALQHAP